MVTKQELEGQWNEVKGRLQDRWGQLTDDELQKVRGNAQQLVGVIQQRTGVARSEIEDFLEEAVSDGSAALRAAKKKASEYSQQAGEAIHAGYEQMSESVRSGYQQAEGMVRRNPLESVAVSFGAGIMTGIILGLVLKPR